jgi:hypothetical protein
MGAKVVGYFMHQAPAGNLQKEKSAGQKFAAYF